MTIMQGYWPQSICLVAQLSFTVIATIKLQQNRDQFPIKQLGPASTLSVLFCFLLANCVSLIGKIIEQSNNYYIIGIDPPISQCRTQHLQLYILGIIFNILQQLPFVVYALKTLRVSICFWRYFNRMDVQKINRCVIGLFKNEAYIIFASVAYVMIINMLVVTIHGIGTSQYNYFYYEYLCPRKSTQLELIVSIFRLLLLGSVFTLSIWTYQQLDFKRYIVVIFLISNLVFIPRFYLAIQHQSVTTYREIYYASFIVNLLQTIATSYYCTQQQQLSPPPMQGVLQSWPAFHNLKQGMIILQDYAIYRDACINATYHERCLQSYSFLDELLKYARIAEDFKLDNFMDAISKILERNQLVQTKLGKVGVMLRSKCADGTLQIKDVKKIQKILSDFCQFVLFQQWKKTCSYYFLKREYITNGDINEKMDLFDIPLS